MSDIAEKLKQKYQERLAGEAESAEIDALDGERIYWRPMTGKQQKQIQSYADKSVAEGICMHVKTRALDKDGKPIFKDIAVVGLMNDFEFKTISDIFFAMTGADIPTDEIEKNS